MFEHDLDPPNFDSMNVLAKRSPRPPSDYFPPEDNRLSEAPQLTSGSDDFLKLRHQHSASSQSTTTRQSRRSIVSLARERTSAAFANLTSIANPSTPSLRSTTSSGSLSRQTGPGFGRSPSLPKSATVTSDLPNGRSATPTMPPTVARREPEKQHSAPSKTMRMTDEGRPYTKEFQDVFSGLVNALPLTPHRVRFSRVEETFLSEEALTQLSSLKVVQTNKIEHPKGSGKMRSASVTTTYTLPKELALDMCQRFLAARFIESAEHRAITTFGSKGGVWQLTPKGISIVSRYYMRHGTPARQVEELMRRPQMQLVTLERVDPKRDKISDDKGTVEVVFRRFAGQDGPNLKLNTQLSDSDSVSEYATGLVGVKMAKERRVMEKTIQKSFTGKAASDWLMDCCTTIHRSETIELCEHFVSHNLIAAVAEDRIYKSQYPNSIFQPTKIAIYVVTEKGQRVCGWLSRDPSISSAGNGDLKERTRGMKDSNSARLNSILQDPALRFLFRDFLLHSMCEENLNFYNETKDFTSNYRQDEVTEKLDRPDVVRDIWGQAYGLYNNYLATGAASELNLDHALRNSFDHHMLNTDKIDGDDPGPLKEIVPLFEHAQTSIFKLMASDSVPKFLRDPRYAHDLRDYDWELNAGARAFSPAPSSVTVVPG